MMPQNMRTICFVCPAGEETSVSMAKAFEKFLRQKKLGNFRVIVSGAYQSDRIGSLGQNDIIVMRREGAEQFGNHVLDAMHYKENVFTAPVFYETGDVQKLAEWGNTIMNKIRLADTARARAMRPKKPKLAKWKRKPRH